MDIWYFNSVNNLCFCNPSFFDTLLFANTSFSLVRYFEKEYKNITQRIIKMIPIRKNKEIKHSGIYQIESFSKDKLYIGSTGRGLSNRVFKEHLVSLQKNKHCNTILQNHFNKYGERDLWFDALEYCDKRSTETLEEYKVRLLEREQYWIDKLNPEFNICKVAGSPLGIKKSKGFKLKMSNIVKGRKASKNTRNNISEAHKGQTAWNKGLTGIYSKETLEKISNTLKGRKLSQEHKNNISKGGKGKIILEETRQKMSLAKTGTHLSDETKQKISRVQKGVPKPKRCKLDSKHNQLTIFNFF